MSEITQSSAPAPARSANPMRLETLVLLRWLAISGQLITVVVVRYGLGYDVPLGACLLLIALSVLVNAGLLIRYGPGHRPSTRLAFLQLAYDSLQLGGLLYLTGGLGNPFAILLLAPVSVSASTLASRETIWVGTLVIAIASALALFHMPLPWIEGVSFEPPRIYLTGVWIAILCAVGFVAGYTNKVAHEARQLVDALTITELALSRQQQLSALDGLAAAAAHELGTPLATIALAAKEIRRDHGEGELAEDLDLIMDQVARCRAILGKLRNLRPSGSDLFDSATLSDIVAELAKAHEGPALVEGKSINLAQTRAEQDEPVIARNVALLYGLGNLIENAVQFAKVEVTIRAVWDGRRVMIAIMDDGPGFPPDLLSRLGEPYLTTRTKDRFDPRQPDGGGGLGLGVFIAKTLLERTGATLKFFNARANGHACVEISWPRDTLVRNAARDV
ncbi:ActS/PrrB/RegB family redox-sensitive histidine kinase [Pelagibacterium nitratireducens]|jgi:two-component system, sensor histidine kinase RegB|uniref:histidine kinase n=1 Tax=Pelagibacterium nitratireducens TaxID=1046114 RepID=A0ABZ2HZS1_9HYPH|nr:two-component sensor histidine kinase [Pelagibacterium sp.]HCO55449.1 two-component sensor histidine kinase [Pelagibacterium sp.]|tara:strand:- start:129 stop:1472 length:1344 start_codon:yes stop_codon:yes gene_type:complete